MKGGCLQKLDLVHGHSERATRGHPNLNRLNLEVDKMNYRLRSLDPD